MFSASNWGKRGFVAYKNMIESSKVSRHDLRVATVENEEKITGHQS